MLEVRCSGLSRPMKCAGSLFFTDLPPEERNPAAEEGTAAGEYLQHLLENNMQAPTATHAKNGHPFDDDMKFYLTPIAEEIRARAHNTNAVLCEQRIDWKASDNVAIRGQFDISYIDASGYLNIDDLKYGWGIVEPVENWQLLAYAIGRLLQLNFHPNGVVLRIYQPRPHHELGPVRTWVIDTDQLGFYRSQISARMMEIEQGDKSLVTGPQCKYCRAAVRCPAANKAFYRGVEVVQNEFLQDSLSPEELSFQLDLITRIEELVKIKKDSLRALAVDRLKQGQIVPNYVTENNYGDRKWKAGIKPEAIKMLTNIDITERVMLSPAKAEKVGVAKEVVNALVDRHFLGPKLKRVDTQVIGNQLFGVEAPKRS